MFLLYCSLVFRAFQRVQVLFVGLLPCPARPTEGVGVRAIPSQGRGDAGYNTGAEICAQKPWRPSMAAARGDHSNNSAIIFPNIPTPDHVVMRVPGWPKNAIKKLLNDLAARGPTPALQRRQRGPPGHFTPTHNNGERRRTNG